MKSKILIFTIALNDYSKKWKKCIESHKKYARKNKYEYCLVKKHFSKINPDLASWLKIPLLLQALQNDYDWVFFIDCDAFIKLNAPRIEYLWQEGKDIYLSRGHSGRVNAGVIIAKNSKSSRHFFKKILSSCDLPIIKEDEKAGAENGFIIHFSKNYSGLKILDRRWNNTIDPCLKDYVRHYTGIMRSTYPLSNSFEGTRFAENKNSPFKNILKIRNIFLRPLHRFLLKEGYSLGLKYPCFKL